MENREQFKLCVCVWVANSLQLHSVLFCLATVADTTGSGDLEITFHFYYTSNNAKDKLNYPLLSCRKRKFNELTVHCQFNCQHTGQHRHIRAQRPAQTQ